MALTRSVRFVQCDDALTTVRSERTGARVEVDGLPVAETVTDSVSDSGTKLLEAWTCIHDERS